jgi:anti-sigma B factor antagonist
MAELERVSEPLPGQLTIRRTRDARGEVLVLCGELDLASAPEVELHLREFVSTMNGRLLIDLSGVDFMDSTGLALIVGAQRAADANGHDLVLRRGPSQVQRLFELTGLLERFAFEDS